MVRKQASLKHWGPCRVPLVALAMGGRRPPEKPEEETEEETEEEETEEARLGKKDVGMVEEAVHDRAPRR